MTEETVENTDQNIKYIYSVTLNTYAVYLVQCSRQNYVMVLVINIKTEDEQFLAQTSSRFQNPMTEFQEWK